MRLMNTNGKPKNRLTHLTLTSEERAIRTAAIRQHKALTTKCAPPQHAFNGPTTVLATAGASSPKSQGQLLSISQARPQIYHTHQSSLQARERNLETRQSLQVNVLRNKERLRSEFQSKINEDLDRIFTKEKWLKKE